METDDRSNDRWLSVTLEEYRSLRQEALHALSQQQTILQFGLSVLGVLVGLGVQQAGKESAVTILVGIAIVPLVAIFVVVIWFGELERLGRVGFHLATIEHSVNKELGRTALWWESALQRANGPYRRLRWRYHAVVAVLLLVAAIGAVVGNIEMADEEAPWAWPLSSLADAALLGGILAWWEVQFGRLGTFGSGARDLTAHSLAELPHEVREQIDSVSKRVRRG